jgi:hypothetical protein
MAHRSDRGYVEEAFADEPRTCLTAIRLFMASFVSGNHKFAEQAEWLESGTSCSLPMCRRSTAIC